MATTKVIGRALYAGQGMCNTIEIYDGATLNYLMLIDFGSEKDTSTARQYTLAKLKALIISHGKIDAMVISHSDKDHWKLMSELLDELPSTVTIDVAAFGIGQWIKSALKFKNKVIDRMTPGKSISIQPDAMSNIASDKLNSWLKTNNVTFNMLAASVTVSDVVPNTAKTIESNTASLVIRCLYEGHYMVFSGDATWATLRYMNNKLNGRPFSNTGFMLTAPHHGALATLGGELTDLATFTQSVQPECALASAQLRVNFNHPNVCVMATMSKYAKKNAYPSGGGNHSCVLNFKETSLCSTNTIYTTLLSQRTAARSQEWYVVDTDYNIFTSVQDLTTVVHWYFEMDVDGGTSVTQGGLTFDITEEFARMAAQPAVEETEFFVGRPPPGMTATARPIPPAPPTPAILLPPIPEA